MALATLRSDQTDWSAPHDETVMGPGGLHFVSLRGTGVLREAGQLIHQAEGTQVEVTEFLEAVTHWATRSDDVRGLALVGSRARGTATPNSDVDLVILCRQPVLLLRNDSWISRFGDVVTRSIEQYGVTTSMRVVYRGGLEAEFGIAAESWAAVPVDPGTLGVISDGMRILHDPARLLVRALRAVGD